MSRIQGPKITCECGKTFYPVNKATHEQSIPHQNYLVWGRKQDHISRKTKYTCECGKRLMVSMKGIHERSVTHKNYRHVQELLKDPMITLQDIATRIGVSREYIRQIANQIQKSWDGRKRQKIGTQRRHSS